MNITAQTLPGNAGAVKTIPTNNSCDTGVDGRVLFGQELEYLPHLSVLRGGVEHLPSSRASRYEAQWLEPEWRRSEAFGADN